MKKILILVLLAIIGSSCTKSTVEAPETIQPVVEIVKDIRRTETVMVSPTFVKDTDNQVLIKR